jgi:small subunit ribosomal protein S3
MEERKFIKLKKEEYGIKEYIKRDLGKGKISKLDIEYTPVGEKIIISTARPGLVIGRRGEKIDDLTQVLKKRFKLENPHIEIREIEQPLFDAQTVADDIAMALERMGNLKFKIIAYKKLQEVMRAGALGCELRLSGKLPSDRAKSWLFTEGYLKKAGESSKEIDRAQAVALTKTGIIGVKVAVMPPTARIYDKIDITEGVKENIKKVSTLEDTKKVKKTKPKEKQTSESRLAERAITHPQSDEDGTAMKIEEEIAEGTPQDIIDEEMKKEAEKAKEKKSKKAKKKSEGGK